MSTDPRHYDVILGPIITEKATAASEQNKVVFRVKKDASKPLEDPDAQYRYQGNGPASV